VFEEFVRVQGNQKIWHKLLIHTNNVQDLMLLVFLDCTNDELKQVRDEMKIFFTSGEGMKYHVASVYIRNVNTYVQSLLSSIPFLGIKQNLIIGSNTAVATCPQQLLCSAFLAICNWPAVSLLLLQDQGIDTAL
jgi:hypothetical protein